MEKKTLKICYKEASSLIKRRDIVIKTPTVICSTKRFFFLFERLILVLRALSLFAVTYIVVTIWELLTLSAFSLSTVTFCLHKTARISERKEL